MLIGTLIQHGNLGPSSPATVQRFRYNIPGRLNDFKGFMYYDFTLEYGMSTNLDNGNTLIQSIRNKFQPTTNDFAAIAQSTTKGPVLTSNGQDGYSYAYTQLSNGLGFNHLYFKTAEDLSVRNFTTTAIFDSELDFGNTSLTYDEIIFQINGSGSQELQLRCFKKETDNSKDTFLLMYTAADGTEYKAFRDADTMQGFTGGDQNNHFMHLTFTVTDGVPKMYIRGVPVALTSPDTFPDETIPKYGSGGGFSTLFNNTAGVDPFGGQSQLEHLRAKVYEVMIFSEALSTSQLKNIDMYVRDKYKSYDKGWINGNEIELSFL